MRTGGVLGKNGLEWSRAHEERFATAYNHIREIVGECYAIVPFEIPADRFERTMVLSTLYIRTLEYMQSTVVLKRCGMAAPARGALRSMLETFFVFAACLRDDANVEIFINQHAHRRLRMHNKVRASNSEGLAWLREKSFEEPYEEIKTEADGVPTVKIEDWARRAGLHDIYVTTYTVLSSGAHPTIQNLLYYRVGEATDVPALDLRPTDDETEFLLGAAVEFLCDVVAGYCSELEIPPPSEIDEWRRFGRELSDASAARVV